jgi:trk system potassium uptake protein TrkA
MTGEFLVIGLGRFGRAVAVGLRAEGQSVLAVDAHEEVVQQIASEVDAAVSADATDERALAELHPERTCCAVVAIGGDSIENSILCTALLRQIGVPRIVARAVTELHGRVLRAVGADEVVNPEADVGARLARRLAQPNVFDQIELGEDADLAEIAVPEAFVGKSLIELDIRRRFAISVVAIRRHDRVRANLDASEQLQTGDVLLAIGSRGALRRIAARA